MRRAFLAGLLALSLSACASTQSGPRTFIGVWEWGFETSSFTTTRGEGPYWLAAEGANWEALQAPLHEPGIGPWGRVAIVVEGNLTPTGQYGHLGAYSRQLRVTRVIEARLLSAARASGQLRRPTVPNPPSGLELLTYLNGRRAPR